MMSSLARAGDLVLDYGCGPGRLGLLLAKGGYRVRGVDTSPTMIQRALELKRDGLDIGFEIINGARQVAQPQSYDAIVCSSVIEYVADPDELLGIFNRALRRPGLLIISYANSSSLWRRYWERRAEANPMFTPNNRTWDWPQFKSLLAKHGFQPICAPRFFDSPCDRYRAGEIFRLVPFAGTVGVLAARPIGDP
jgi:SAM-dependent methyltransferase